MSQKLTLVSLNENKYFSLLNTSEILIYFECFINVHINAALITLYIGLSTEVVAVNNLFKLIKLS